MLLACVDHDNVCILYSVQAKEKLISSLQGGASGGANAISEAQLEEMRVEKEHVQAQLLTAQQQLELCKATMQVCV